MKRIGIALGLFLTATAAMAQQFPTVPAQTVIGRLGTPGDTGPSSAIPISTFLNTRPLAAGQIIVGNNSGLQANVTLSGDCTMSSLGVIVCLKTNGSLFGTMATQNANAVAITGGTIAYTPPGTGAVATTLDAALHKAVWIKDFGALCDGATNDTTAIQNAWNYAASVNLDVWLGGVGPTCKISTLTMPTPVAIGLGSGFGAARASMLHGPGANQVILLSTVTGTTCAITVTGVYGTTSSLEGKFSGFGVNQILQNQAGDGICLNNITKATFEDVSLSFFAVGLNANDAILLNIEKSWFEANTVQISGQQVSNSGPNGWNIDNNHFSNSGLYSIRLAAPNMVNIRGNDFESEGIPNTTSAVQVFVSSLSPSSGALGVNVVGNYIEGNAGFALQIAQGSQTVKSVHNFTNNIMARTRADNSGAILISNSSAGAGALMYVNVGGNGLFDVNGGGGFTWLAASASGATNYLFNCSQVANIVVPTTNMNATCVLASTGFR